MPWAQPIIFTSMHSPTELSLETISDDRVRKAFAYWNEARKGRLMPARSDIDPLDLRFCLGWICMIDVQHGSHPRFRFRLDGSKLVHLTGFDLTGKYVDQIEWEDYRRLAEMVYGRVVETKKPLFLGNMEDWLERGFYMESVTLPLSDNGSAVTGLMEVVCPAKTLNSRQVVHHLSLGKSRHVVGAPGIPFLVANEA
jgi:hypothetical protein